MKRLISFLLRVAMLPSTKAPRENLDGHTMAYNGLVSYIDSLIWTEAGNPVPHEVHWFLVDETVVKIDLDERSIYVDSADPFFPLDRDKEMIPSKYVCAVLHHAMRMVFEGATVDGRIADKVA